MNPIDLPVRLGIIGGSGLYDIDGLSDYEWINIESGYGTASDEILMGNIDGLDVAFLPRHGRKHSVLPSEINYRANIDCLKRCGVTDIISLSAVGSLKEELVPGDFAIVEQFIDNTFARTKSFFGRGVVAHVSMANPVCRRINSLLIDAAQEISTIRITSGRTHIVMEGPQFSSRAESNLYRSWGCDMIGMTNMPEAKLAREAEICYSAVGMITDYDCWHDGHSDVTVDEVIRVLNENSANARELIKIVARNYPRARSLCPATCDRALEGAIMTNIESLDKVQLQKLHAVAGRVLKSQV